MATTAAAAATTSRTPISTVMLSLPDQRQLNFAYPSSSLMEKVCQNILVRGEYPPLPFLNCKTIVDVGANVGATAIVFSAQYPGATIYALEPAREAFEFLERNTSSLPQVRRFHCGAFDKDMAALLHLGSEASVTNSLIANVLTDGVTETIQLRRLTTFFAEQGIDHVSLLKLDTEGAELPILRDILPMLPEIDAMFIEYHSEADRLELDRMLTPAYTLYASRAEHPHRGLLCYVAKPILEAKTTWDQLRLDRP